MTRPRTTSAALAALVSLAAVAVVARAASVTAPAALSSAGAVLLAVALWAAGRERYRAAATFLASLLLLPVGIGAFAATAGTVLVVAGRTFPVPSLAEVPPAVIRVAARSLVVVGATLAVLGAATTPRAALDRTSIRRLSSATLATAIPPFLAGGVLSVTALLTASGSGADALVGQAIDAFRTLVFRPSPTRPHLPTFALVVGSGMLAAGSAVRALPLAELTTGRATAADPRSPLGLLERIPVWAGAALLLAVPVLVPIQVSVSTRALAGTLGPALYRALTALTTAPWLRTLGWWLFVLGAAVTLLVQAVVVLARRSTDRVAATVAPFAAGAVFVLGAFVVARPVTDAGVNWLAATLPGDYGTVAGDVGRSVVALFGPTAVVLLLVTGLLLLVAGGVGVLWLGAAAGYLDDRTAGVTLAAAGPFLAAAAAGALGVALPIVLAGLVAALVAWDVGEFGVTLADEVGHRASTRRAELVHAGGAVAVGAVGAGVATGLADLAGGPLLATGETVLAGLLAGLAGLAFLTVALR
ncbi:MAG: hypothetical protein ABEJ89_01700 [Haloarculaceae archaeon]